MGPNASLPWGVESSPLPPGAPPVTSTSLLVPRLVLSACVVAAALGCAEGEGAADEANEHAVSDPTSASDAEFEEARNHAFRLFDQQRSSDSAIEALESAHAMRPEAYGVNVRLGRAYAERKLHDKALQHDLLALNARPEESETRLQAVTLLGRVGRQAEALEYIPPLLEDPEYLGGGLYQQAYLLDTLGRRDEALAPLERAATLPPDEAYRAHSLYGFFLFQAGEYERALELFESAVLGRADYKETLKGLQDCNRRLGREDAAQHWGEVLQLVLELTDNTYTRKQRSLRIPVLERLTEIHGQWTDAWFQLADTYRREGLLAEGCAAFADYLREAGDTLPADERERLTEKFCPGGLP
jgi:tetratricopeptide (TPR) repeat protein